MARDGPRLNLLTGLSFGVHCPRRSAYRALLSDHENKRFVVLLLRDDLREADGRLGKAWQRVVTRVWDRNNPFSWGAEESPAHKVVALEVDWSALVGIDYRCPLHDDGKLVLEARLVTKRCFKTVEDARDFYSPSTLLHPPAANRRATLSAVPTPNKLSFDGRSVSAAGTRASWLEPGSPRMLRPRAASMSSGAPYLASSAPCAGADWSLAGHPLAGSRGHSHSHSHGRGRSVSYGHGAGGDASAADAGQAGDRRRSVSASRMSRVTAAAAAMAAAAASVGGGGLAAAAAGGLPRRRTGWGSGCASADEGPEPPRRHVRSSSQASAPADVAAPAPRTGAVWGLAQSQGGQAEAGTTRGVAAPLRRRLLPSLTAPGLAGAGGGGGGGGGGGASARGGEASGGGCSGSVRPLTRADLLRHKHAEGLVGEGSPGGHRRVRSVGDLREMDVSRKHAQGAAASDSQSVASGEASGGGSERGKPRGASERELAGADGTVGSTSSAWSGRSTSSRGLPAGARCHSAAGGGGGGGLVAAAACSSEAARRLARSHGAGGGASSLHAEPAQPHSHANRRRSGEPGRVFSSARFNAASCHGWSSPDPMRAGGGGAGGGADGSDNVPRASRWTRPSGSYRAVTLVLSFRDPMLPTELRRFVKSDLRLLKMYESGLPPWAVLLPSYGLPYRPWMRRVLWLLFIAISVFSMTCGFYDLYKNVVTAVASRMYLPAAELFEWLEHHTQIRMSILLTYLFSKSPLLLSFMKMLRALAALLQQLLAPAATAASAALAPVVAAAQVAAASLGGGLDAAADAAWRVAQPLVSAASASGREVFALFAIVLGPPARAVFSLLVLLAQLVRLVAALLGMVLVGPLQLVVSVGSTLGYLGSAAAEHAAAAWAAVSAAAQWTVTLGRAAGRVAPAVKATARAATSAAQAAGAAGGSVGGGVAVWRWLGLEVVGAWHAVRLTFMSAIKSAQAVLNCLSTVACAAAKHRVSLTVQLCRWVTRQKDRLPPAVAASVPQLLPSMLSMPSFDSPFPAAGSTNGSMPRSRGSGRRARPGLVLFDSDDPTTSDNEEMESEDGGLSPTSSGGLTPEGLQGGGREYGLHDTPRRGALAGGGGGGGEGRGMRGRGGLAQPIPIPGARGGLRRRHINHSSGGGAAHGTAHRLMYSSVRHSMLDSVDEEAPGDGDDGLDGAHLGLGGPSFLDDSAGLEDSEPEPEPDHNGVPGSGLSAGAGAAAAASGRGRGILVGGALASSAPPDRGDAWARSLALTRYPHSHSARELHVRFHDDEAEAEERREQERAEEEGDQEEDEDGEEAGSEHLLRSCASAPVAIAGGLSGLSRQQRKRAAAKAGAGKAQASQPAPPAAVTQQPQQQPGMRVAASSVKSGAAGPRLGLSLAGRFAQGRGYEQGPPSPFANASVGPSDADAAGAPTRPWGEEPSGSHGPEACGGGSDEAAPARPAVDSRSGRGQGTGSGSGSGSSGVGGSGSGGERAGGSAGEGRRGKGGGGGCGARPAPGPGPGSEGRGPSRAVQAF
ncbi:hypothetical protein HYH03_010305 [Edaphochlamys debaryana]|uniref:Uncharacterized protein n=1 Tax=Edaphochlamys debaryana TaxID=47281 RepID=A0A835Y596_9CHLO|nr:hypothetical protein HYH03_010305 [Edaphochlamys debaryana]|eukprot:KAG2491299.1 hypothetical protein HYH03_010305 [Edaphochlamys debaryana]